MNRSQVIAENVSKLSAVSDVESRLGTRNLPSIEMVQKMVELSKQVIFPEYFTSDEINYENRCYYIGVCMDQLYDLLRKQIFLSFSAFKKTEMLEDDIDELSAKFLCELPEIKRVLYTDVDAMFHSDPAVTSYSEIIFCYPIMQVMIHYRIAHALHKLGVPVLPRIITEMAHSKTGIDIHPGAQIGEYFSIDHGTGVVIGETCIIGDHVTLYQGVTLGAKSFSFDDNGVPLNTPRHPIIEDHVTIYSNTSILGRITIGHHTIVGGNVWLTNSVSPYSKVLQQKAIATTFSDGAGI